LARALWAGVSPDAAREITPRLPSLDAVFPQGCRPGEKVAVEVLGEFLDRAADVVFLDPALRGRVTQSSYTRLLLEFSASAGAPLGPHYFRIVSRRGASNLLLFRIGDQPHIVEKEPNSTLADAQQVSIPATINGRLDHDGDFDFFRFQVRQGDTWIFDVRSARNGNGLDPALILLDSKGRKLAHSEDVFIWDPFLEYTFAEAGTCYAVVQPTHTHNDPAFAYQLDIRTAPHLETITPISMRPGTDQEATLFGAGLRGSSARLWFDSPGFSGEVLSLNGSTAQVRIRVPGDASEGPHQVAMINEGGRSAPATFLVDATPAYREGQPIATAVSITGIARYREPERFPFDVRAGDTLVFEVRAQRFGSPVDSILRITDENGKELAFNDDAKLLETPFNKDSLLMHKFEQGGKHFVEIRNLYKTAGEDVPYQLLIRSPRPDYDLLFDSDHPYVYANGAGSLKVTTVSRDGYDGPYAAEVTGLPAEIQAARAEVPAGSAEIEIALHAGGAQPGSHWQVRVVGRHPASANVEIKGPGGEGATYAEVREATLAVVERPLFALEAGVTTLNAVRGGTAEVPVTIQRANGFTGAVRFRFENLPDGIEIEELTASGAQDRAKIRLHVGQGVRPGRYARIAIIGASEGTAVEEAPAIKLVVD
jgi:hypothetical protein